MVMVQEFEASITTISTIIFSTKKVEYVKNEQSATLLRRTDVHNGIMLWRTSVSKKKKLIPWNSGDFGHHWNIWSAYRNNY